MTQHIRFDMQKAEGDFGQKQGLRTWVSSSEPVIRARPKLRLTLIEAVEKKIKADDPLQAARGWNF